MFSHIHLATKEQQENFLTKLTGMTSIWSKQNKSEINYLPEAEYWVHPSSVEPNRSADHARAAAEPLTDHYSGVMYPSHPCDVQLTRRDYAPPYLIARIKYGRYGTFDLEKMVTEGSSARPCQVGEAELMDLIHEYFPPVRYVSFHKGFVDVDWWQEFARHEMNLRRHAHSCLRIEAVVCSPTRTDCQKSPRTGEVHVLW